MDFKTAFANLHAADPDRDYILISHAISRELHDSLSRDIAANKKSQKATLFLNTYGGDPDGAFRLGRCLRHHYKEELRIVVPHWCKSAGTLVAIAGSELAIGDFGELGPLDIQVYKGSELSERSSGLDITEAMGAVTSHIKESFHLVLKETRSLGLSTKLSAEFAAQVTAAIASPLFSQLDPLRFGELARMTRVADEYGARLNEYSRNLKAGALVSLIHDYPSHNFVIDRKEAKKLFERVHPMSTPEIELCDSIWHLLAEQASIALLLQPPAPATVAAATTNSDIPPAGEPANEEPTVTATAERVDRDDARGNEQAACA